jgi:murein DD-endopeptidase MepM/ murein hydrolase activator NlpD
MRGTKWLLVAAAAGAVSACIPSGAGDYRIGKNSDPSAPVAAEQPVAKPSSRVATSDPVSILPVETPSWNPSTVERNARQVDGSRYMVRAGDTLYRIGNETGAGAEAIAHANGLTPPFPLKVGAELTVPGGLYHRVAAGETGIAIARAYAVDWAEVVTVNSLEAPYALRSGQYLRLPDGLSLGQIEVGTPTNRPGSFVLDIDDIVTGGQPAAPEVGAAPSRNFVPVVGPKNFSGNFGWPLAGTILSRFGSKGGGQVNDGVDIGAAAGSPIAATANGVVVYAGNEIGVYGGLVLIDHGGGWVSAYGHMSSLSVKRGDKVVRGQSIGGVGATGYVDQPQLHFELRRDRKPVDPLTQLPAR